MIANYHTHTPRCNHAQGTEREYALEAQKAGLKILGFSDHSPQLFPDGYRSGIRMEPEQVEDYARQVRLVRAEFAGMLEVHLGVEMEYYPALFSDTVAMLRDAGVEYLLLGQHFLGNEMGEAYAGTPTEDVTILDRYCRQVMDGMQTGRFTYLAHPDLIRYQGDEGIYRDRMRRLCREARSCGVPLEWNLLGQATGRHYPNLRFWELAAEEGCACILGRDAHDPKAFRDKDTETHALTLLRSLNLPPLETLPLRPL